MASAKQIAWRKKFAKMAKSGKFKKSKKSSSSKKEAKPSLMLGRSVDYHRKKLRELGYSERTINQFLRKEFPLDRNPHLKGKIPQLRKKKRKLGYDGKPIPRIDYNLRLAGT